ncbi:hypothetical protein VHEMI09905 [[Torrubiella] hemipterigena]|uniref:Rhodopsin domain-containing protein n=1 Tax=[Torrubiella] hemipterigena TaxID=1531966 RepID=A0A0A1TR61_9HYPO|nr:hypothetical protein VHEMI09905 [[Torrubiella] hemipterigena]
MTDLDDASHVSQQGLAAIVWVCFAVSTVFVASRLTVRSYNHRSLQTDDIWIILGWISMLLMSILCMLQSQSIWHVAAVEDGRVVQDQAKADWYEEQQARWHFALVYLFWVALWCVKASFLAVFYQVLYPFRIQRTLWYTVTIFVTLAFLGCAISSIFNCERPGDYFQAGKCEGSADIHRQRFNILFSTVLDVVSNVAIIGLQLSVLPVLSLDRRKKIGLGVIFGLNLFVVCVAVLRMAQILMDDKIDVVGLDIWSAVEICTALIIGSLPPLNGLLSRLRRKRRASQKRSEASLESDLDTDVIYAHGSMSNTVMRIESILMDDAHRNSMRDGGIYVQRMFSIHVETQSEMELGAACGDTASDAPINSSEHKVSKQWWQWWTGTKK